MTHTFEEIQDTNKTFFYQQSAESGSINYDEYAHVGDQFEGKNRWYL